MRRPWVISFAFYRCDGGLFERASRAVGARGAGGSTDGIRKISADEETVSRKSAGASATSPVTRPGRIVPDRDPFDDADEEAAMPLPRRLVRFFVCAIGRPRRIRIGFGRADEIGNPAGIIAA